VFLNRFPPALLAKHHVPVMLLNTVLGEHTLQLLDAHLNTISASTPINNNNNNNNSKDDDNDDDNDAAVALDDDQRSASGEYDVVSDESGDVARLMPLIDDPLVVRPQGMLLVIVVLFY
jgi:hypothetical protein